MSGTYEKRKGILRVWMYLGDLGEDQPCEVEYVYKALNTMDDSVEVEVISLYFESMGFKLNPKFLTESALEYVEDIIIDHEQG